MKNINITMTVSAMTTRDAENIAQRELMEFAKIIGMHSGSSMASGDGNAIFVDDNTYQIDATVQIDGNGDIDSIIKDAQRAWTRNPNIINSMIFVSNKADNAPNDEDAYVCDCCGKTTNDAVYIFDPEDDDGYDLCESCFNEAVDNGDVAYCPKCGMYVTNIVENPVTHEHNICPACGEIIC